MVGGLYGASRSSAKARGRELLERFDLLDAGRASDQDLLGAVAWSLVIVAVFAPLAVARYRRAAGG